MSDTDEPVSLRSMIEVVEKQRNPGQRLNNLIFLRRFLRHGDQRIPTRLGRSVTRDLPAVDLVK